MSGWRIERGVGPAVLALLLAGCGRAPEGAEPPRMPPAERILRVSQRNEPASLDPAATTLPDEFGDQVGA